MSQPVQTMQGNKGIQRGNRNVGQGQGKKDH
jgi:hypothetical protein